MKSATARASAALALLTSWPAAAADLLVAVNGLKDDRGEVGCALHRSADGFPMDSATARSQWVRPKAGAAECRFENVEPGTYAVAVSVDRNGKRKTDKNFLGMPTEPWGVSGNARPRMRPPRFDEASFEIRAGQPSRIEIKVD